MAELTNNKRRSSVQAGLDHLFFGKKARALLNNDDALSLVAFIVFLELSQASKLKRQRAYRHLNQNSSAIALAKQMGLRVDTESTDTVSPQQTEQCATKTAEVLLSNRPSITLNTWKSLQPGRAVFNKYYPKLDQIISDVGHKYLTGDNNNVLQRLLSKITSVFKKHRRLAKLLQDIQHSELSRVEPELILFALKDYLQNNTRSKQLKTIVDDMLALRYGKELQRVQKYLCFDRTSNEFSDTKIAAFNNCLDAFAKLEGRNVTKADFANIKEKFTRSDSEGELNFQETFTSFPTPN